MTSEEVEKIVKNLPEDMRNVLINATGDAIDMLYKFADYMRKNFVPVSVIEDIKLEINELSELDHIEPTYEDCKRDVLEILDKHKASPTGAESENKE